MLYSSIHVDLPSEELLRRKTALEWIAGLIGRNVALGTGEGELRTVTGLSLFERIVAGLSEVGITDVLSVLVDHKLAYVDTDANSGDLATAVAELDARGLLERPFESMHMVLSRRHEGLHALVDVRLHRRVAIGAPELQIALAGRVEALQIRRGEGPSDYAERLRAVAREPAPIVRAQAEFAQLVTDTAAALERALAEQVMSIDRSPVELRLVRPGPRALDRFRRLAWGPAVQMPSYRAVPAGQGSRAAQEPFRRHYDDPYFDFATWVLLTEIVAGRGWLGLDYAVLDEAGERLWGPANAVGQAPVGGDVADPVTIVDGAVVVDPAVPTFADDDPNAGADVDPRRVPGFAGDASHLGVEHAGHGEPVGRGEHAGHGEHGGHGDHGGNDDGGEG